MTPTRARRRARHRPATLALVIVLAGVAGGACGETATGRAPTLTPTASSSTGPPTAPSDGGAKVRLVGHVVAVRPGHVVLEDGNGMRWAVVGEAVRGWQVGQRVQVTGISRPDTERGGHPLVVARDTTAPRGS